ncbi:MAG: T9SS type A sorting domain-containing protein, partial [Thermoplasmata archaeon]|nr:T9SS type A sorting domain-containing protein [Thermoplasmata archaeon]
NGITVDDEGDIYFSGTVGVPASIYISKLQGEQVTVVGDELVSRHPGLVLGHNYPNPFNPATSITYAIPEGTSTSHVNLSIYDVGGRLVKQLVNESQTPGNHTVTWRGLDERGFRVSGGVYFYRLIWGGESIAKQMMMLK